MMEFKTGRSEQALVISLNTGTGEAPGASAAKPYAQRRRDRHGRGFRGSLIPAPLPGYRTRSEAFDELVVESADRLRNLWPGTLDLVEYVVEEVPSDLEALIASGALAPLGNFSRAESNATGLVKAAEITIYRHPLEALCDTAGQLRELVHEVLVEQVAGLMDMDPEAVDPSFRRHRGH